MLTIDISNFQKQKTADLSQAIQKIGAEMYGSAGSPQSNASGQNPPTGGPSGEGQQPEEGKYKEK